MPLPAGLPRTPIVETLDARLRGPGSDSVVRADDVELLRTQTGLDDHALALGLLGFAQRWALAPISKFEVGAVAVASSGAMYLGANIEFPGLPLSQTVHAEQAAIWLALAHGEHELRAVAASAAPCGFCRQFMLELPEPRPVLLLADHGTEAQQLSQLLPLGFDGTALGQAPQLLRAPTVALRLVGSGAASSELVDHALGFACRSSAPYSGALAGVALETGDGRRFGGGVAESAAYNPTLNPMQAALIAAHHGGAQLAEIREAALVELEHGAVSQLASARQVLASVAPAAVLSRRFASGSGTRT